MIKPPRALIWISAAVLLSAFFALTGFYKSELPAAVIINTRGQPTIGYPKAKVHVVVFEEPKCSNCKEYAEKIFPKLKKDFIDTNKITYTVIPVSFLPGSMPAAVALLCVYYADPLYPNSDLFFTYLDYMYAHQPDEYTDWATVQKLMHFAEQASPAINTSKLKKCIDLDTYRIKIEQNTNYGKQLMGGIISTPTLYVNGIEVKELTYERVRDLIKQVLQNNGVY